MSVQPQLPSSNLYNPSLFGYDSSYLTITTADKRYIRLGTNITAPSITATTISASSISGTLSTAAQPNITSLGTLSSLTVSGALNGILSTAAQPNITSLGTLSSLTVSGALNGTLSTAAQPNITTTARAIADNVCGIEDKTQSTISYNPTTRVFTITPTGASFIIWVKSQRFVISTAQSTSPHPTTSGLNYWIYFNSSGVLSIQDTFPGLSDIAMVACVYYYSASETILFEERHSTVMDPETHIELHFNIGTYYKSGLALSNYTIQPLSPINSDNLWHSSAGEIADEDLVSSISAVSGSNYTVIRLIGTSALWTFTTGLSNPFLYSTYISYNKNVGGNWQMSALAANKYVNYYLMYVPSTESNKQILIVPGQTEYSNLASAQAASFSNLTTSSLLLAEFIPLYKIIYSTSAAYTNNGKCRIESVERLVSSRVQSISNPISNHQSLSGLQLAASGSTYGHISDTTQTIAGAKTFSDGIYTTLLTAAQPNITSLGTLTGLSLNGAMNLSVPTTINNSIQITGGAAFTTANGLCIRFEPMSSTAGINSYNHAMSSQNNLNINNGAVYCKSNGNVGIGTLSPSYRLDVNGSITMNGDLRNGPTVFMNNAGLIQVAAQTSITSVGTLTGLTVSGATSITNTTDSSSSITGALIVSGGVGIAKKLYVGTGIYGTLQTAAQTNITSVGTLTGLASSAAINIASTTSGQLSITNSLSSGLANLLLVNDTSTWEVGIRGSTASDPKNGFYIYNGAYRFIIDSTGKIGVGKIPSVAKLDIDGDINAASGYLLAGSSMLASSLTAVSAGTVSASKAMVVDSNRGISNMGSLSINDTNAFPLNVYNSGLTTTNAIGINIGKSANTNESFQMKFNYDTTSTDTSYLSFSPYGATNSLTIKSNENIGFRSISNPLWPIHGPNLAQDQVLALYCTAVDADFYGIGTNSNSMIYQAAQKHLFYYGSKGKTSGDGKGTLIGQFDASGLYVERYTSGSDVSGTYSYLNSTAFLLNEAAPSATYSYSIQCAQGVVVDSGGFFARSDFRLKKDIVFYNDEHKQRIVEGFKKLNICSFIMKEDEMQKRTTGVIAQEVVKCGLQELISFIRKDGLKIEGEYDIENYALTVQYEKIGLMLIPVVQDLYKEIEYLKEQLNFILNKEYLV